MTVLIAACAAGYLASSLVLPRRRRAGLALFGASWLLNAGVFVVNWVVAGEPPFGNMYHVLTILSLCFLPFYVLLALRDEMDRLAVYFAATSAVPLLGALFMKREVAWRRLPALRSVWFTPHVMSYVLSYSLAAVAFVLTLVPFLRKAALKREDDGRYEESRHRVLLLAFPFMTFGLLLGAVWADAAWGDYWSWDPKETWSLITWTLYLIYFHCRRSPRLRRFAGAVQVLAFLALLTTFLLVNLLPRLSGALHSYA